MSAPDLAICADRDHDWYCTKAHGHLGEHAAITVSGVTRHRWTQTTPGDAVTDRAPASSGAPSLVELDRQEAWLEFARDHDLPEGPSLVRTVARDTFMAGWAAGYRAANR